MPRLGIEIVDIFAALRHDRGMPRTVKRYGSRKLYDSRESRYVSLAEIAAWIRGGEDVRVLDNRSGDDVTTQVLAQAIVDAGKRGAAVPPKELLHELIRSGEAALTEGAQRLQEGVERVVQAGVDRIGPVRRLREETARLRARLEEVEASLADFADAAGGQTKKRRTKTQTTKKRSTSRRGATDTN